MHRDENRAYKVTVENGDFFLALYEDNGDLICKVSIDTALTTLSPLHLALDILERAEHFERGESYAIANNKAMTPEWAFQIDQNIIETLSNAVSVAKRILDKIIGYDARFNYNQNFIELFDSCEMLRRNNNE